MATMNVLIQSHDGGNVRLYENDSRTLCLTVSDFSDDKKVNAATVIVTDSELERIRDMCSEMINMRTASMLKRGI